jgi:plastocyanin
MSQWKKIMPRKS